MGRFGLAFHASTWSAFYSGLACLGACCCASRNKSLQWWKRRTPRVTVQHIQGECRGPSETFQNQTLLLDVRSIGVRVWMCFVEIFVFARHRYLLIFSRCSSAKYQGSENFTSIFVLEEKTREGHIIAPKKAPSSPVALKCFRTFVCAV